jgi:hypothetical protein
VVTNHSLDDLASGLASGTVTRRRALAILGASVVGLAFPGIARATGEDDKDDKHDKCGKPCVDWKDCKDNKKCKKCDYVDCKDKPCNLEGKGKPHGEGECGIGCECVPKDSKSGGDKDDKKGVCKPKARKVCQKKKKKDH